MNFMHYEDITPDFNDPNWAIARRPKPDDYLFASYNAEVVVEVEAEHPVKLNTETYFVARINLNNTFTTYWADKLEVYEGVLFRGVDILANLRDISGWHKEAYYVLTWGRKVYNLEDAEAVFAYLPKIYGIQAVL